MKNFMEISFSAKLSNVTFARSVATSFLMDLDLMLNELNEVKTIISEAVTNSIVHGYNEDEKKLVFMKLMIEDDELTMIVIDKGCGISDITKAREPLYSSRQDEDRAGLGFTIMEIFSDEINVESVLGEGTKVTCVKKMTISKI